MKVEYKIEKSRFPEGKNKWLVVKYSTTQYGYGVGRIFKGTKKECEEYKKKVEEERNVRESN